MPITSTMNKDAESEDEMQSGTNGHDDEKRKKPNKKPASTKNCQAEKCSVDLTDAKTYHRRHKVCEHHAKAQVVVVAGIRQRFCQQCSRFHELSEFDDTKRSCRRRLAGHNERRRKNPADHSQAGEGGSGRIKGGVTAAGGGGQIKDIMCGQESASYKHFQAR